MNHNDLEPQVYCRPWQYQVYATDDCYASDDCACALSTPTISPAPLPTAARWQAAPGLYRAALAPGYELVSPVYGPVGAVVLNSAAGRVLDALAGEPCSVEQAAARLPDMAPEAVHGAVQNLAALNLVESV